MSAIGLLTRAHEAYGYAQAELVNERAILRASYEGRGYPAHYILARERQIERLKQAVIHLAATIDALRAA